VGLTLGNGDHFVTPGGLAVYGDPFAALEDRQLLALLPHESASPA